MQRRDCLSHQIWPHIEKGWKDTPMKPIHFFWGLGGSNLKDIKTCIENGEEWWYVDVGYLTKQIQRYPEPKIVDSSNTYFRIIKGGIHTIRMKVADGKRLNELTNKGIDTEFKGWYTGDCKHILLAPSSQTVTYHINGTTQDEWVKQVTAEIKKYTDMPIKFRNKPRPGNQWYNTDIKDDLKDCHCLVTNMSLSAIDAVLNKVPVIVHQRNVCAPISGRDISKIQKPLKPGRKTMEEWMKMIAQHQFTLEEMGNGTAYKVLKEQEV